MDKIKIQRIRLFLKRNFVSLLILIITSAILYSFSVYKHNTSLPYLFYFLLPFWLIFIKFYMNKDYQVTKDEKSINITIMPRIGFIRKIPFDRCQSIIIKQDPLDKLFSIYKIVIQSSNDTKFFEVNNNIHLMGFRRWLWDFYGDEDHSFVEGLTLEQVKELKDYIENQSKRASGQEIESSYIKNMYLGGKLTGRESLELLTYVVSFFVLIWLSVILYVSSF